MSDDPVILVGGTILVAGGIFLAYPWIAALLAAAIGCAYGIRAAERALDKADSARIRRAERIAEIVARANQQHAQVLAGDLLNGIYGNYPPVHIPRYRPHD